MTPDPTAQDIMAIMTQHPTLDEFFLRNPANPSPEDRRRLVTALRDDRALFIAKDEKKREEKETEND